MHHKPLTIRPLTVRSATCCVSSTILMTIVVLLSSDSIAQAGHVWFRRPPRCFLRLPRSWLPNAALHKKVMRDAASPHTPPHPLHRVYTFCPTLRLQCRGSPLASCMLSLSPISSTTSILTRRWLNRGAGLCGLVLALALEKYAPDVDFQIYESAAELTIVGAGIAFQPRSWYIIKELGLEAAMLKFTGDGSKDST